MIQKEINIFKTIAKLASFIYIKDTYTNFNTFNKDNDIEKLQDVLKKLEKYAHLPNKTKIIENAYNSVIEQLDNNYLDEEKFFALIPEEIKDLKKNEKKYILYSIIYVAYNDQEISDTEKESILQIASFLELNTNYKKILAEYNRSDFGKPLSKFYIAFSIFIFICVVTVGVYLIYNYKTNKIDNFDKKYVAFSEVFFNRYIIYKNAFDTGGEYFEKQVIFYLGESAEIAFNSKNSSLSYNPVNHVVTYSYSGNFPFDLKQKFTSEVLVDEIEPKKISEEDARNLGFIVGIVSGIGGAYLGKKASPLISLVLPPNLAPVSSLVGGAVGGIAGSATGYFVTSNMLKGLKITSSISQKEKEAVVYAGKELILAVLKADEEMTNMYKNQFVKYIKGQYVRNGINVSKVEFKQRGEK